MDFSWTREVSFRGKETKGSNASQAGGLIKKPKKACFDIKNVKITGGHWAVIPIHCLYRKPFLTCVIVQRTLLVMTK